MINDAQNCLHKYEREIACQKPLYSNATDQEWTTTLEKAISVQHQKTRTKKRIALQDKLSKISHNNDMDNTETWIKNISNRPHTDTKKTVLVHGLNYNYRDTKKTDFLAALELTLKNNGLTEEIQQTIRQMTVPTLSRKDTPIYGLANELQQKLKYLVDNTTYSIHSSQEFLNMIKDIRIEEDKIMISFD
eukprot:g39804.t1